MTRVVIGAADQALALDLRAALAEMDHVEVAFVAESTAEFVAAVVRSDPDVVLVHDLLGPEPALQTVRDITLRRPTCAALVVTGSATADTMSAAVDAGARGTVTYPLTFEQLQSRLQAAQDWSQQMRRLLDTASTAGDGTAHGRGSVLALAGGKGGVGTTTLAVHLALEVLAGSPELRVCLVDLDLEKGDVSGVLELRHRVSIADVAKVSDDLSSRTVADAVVAHESGLHLLLPPADVRELEVVTPRALRQVFAVLRQDYDLVVVDAGSHVTPVQATVVEIADEVVAVVTPDVLAMRGLRRVVNAWESLAVRKEQDIRVLVNRVSRAATISFDTVRRLTRAPVLSAGVPAMFLRLEPAINSRDPRQIRDAAWWKAIRAIRTELGLSSGGTTGAAVNGAGGNGVPPSRSRAAARASGRRRRSRRDSGSVTLETVGLLPVVLLVAVLAWQAALYGLSFVWVGHASNAAARALAVGADPAVAARDAVPASVADDLTVSPSPATATVHVRLAVPMVAPGVARLPVTVSAAKGVVREP